MDSKKTGSFYTPECVIEFMFRYLKRQGQRVQQVLEPAAGDGRFLSALLRYYPNCIIDAVELFEGKVLDMKDRISGQSIKYFTADFLDYALAEEKRYDLIIGNPPYISLKNMDDGAIEKARQLFKAEEIPASVMCNLWSAFIVGAVRLLKAKGTIFYILPEEFLQVQFAEKLRGHLEKKFTNIKIFTFETSLFSAIEQRTCLVYLSNLEDASPYIDYYVYNSPASDLPIKQSRIEKSKPLKKWTNAVLDDEDIAFLSQCANQYPKIDTMCTCAPGIVTGGNQFFIVSAAFVEENQAQEYVLPILQKSSLVKRNTIIFNRELFNLLRMENVPVFLLNLANRENIPAGVLQYLNKEGERMTGRVKLKDRYKCKHRKPWYAVPVGNYGDVFFFKRSDKLPRLFINQMPIHTTDAGYHLRLKKPYEAASFVFCFFNSLTLAQCEYNGRYYGGGVLELVPSEFKSLSVPYQHVPLEYVETLDKMFRGKKPVKDIISFVNEKTVSSILSKEEMDRLDQIRDTLMARRLRNM